MKSRNEILSELSKSGWFQISDREMMDPSEENIQDFINNAEVEYTHVSQSGADVAIVTYENKRLNSRKQVAFVWANGKRNDDINPEGLRKQVSFQKI